MKRSTCLITIILVSFSLMVFSQTAVSANCGDASPSVKKGIDPRTSIKPTELTTDQIDQITKLFKSLKGKWKGTAQVSECIPKEGRDVMRKETVSVDLTVEMENRDSAVMEFEIRSPEKGTRKNVIENLYIDLSYLMFNDGPFNFKASVLYQKDNFITYLRKTKLPGKGNIPIESVRTLAVYSQDSLMIEDISYVNGMLSSRTLYELK